MSEQGASTNNRMQMIAGVLGVATIVAIGIAIFTFNQSQTAQQNEADALAAGTEAADAAIVAIDNQATAEQAATESADEAATALANQEDAEATATQAQAEEATAIANQEDAEAVATESADEAATALANQEDAEANATDSASAAETAIAQQEEALAAGTEVAGEATEIAATAATAIANSTQASELRQTAVANEETAVADAEEAVSAAETAIDDASLAQVQATEAAATASAAQTAAADANLTATAIVAGVGDEVEEAQAAAADAESTAQAAEEELVAAQETIEAQQTQIAEAEAEAANTKEPLPEANGDIAEGSPDAILISLGISPNNGSLDETEGEVVLDLSEDGVSSTGIGGTYEDFVIYTSFEWGPGDIGCGVYARYTSDGFYFMTVNKAGSYGLGVLGEEYISDESFVNSTNAINTDENDSNEFVLVGSGDELTFVINGVIVDQVTNDRHDSGGVGLFAFNFEESGKAWCTFTNSWVWELEDEVNIGSANTETQFANNGSTTTFDGFDILSILGLN